MEPDSIPARRAPMRLLMELGRGGMGIVFLAVAHGPGNFSKLKVIKRLRPDLAAEPRALGMFLDEARLAARLLHPNIVQTNEVGFDGKHHFLEMEYLEGQSYEMLVRRAATAGGLALPLSLYVLTRTLAGLHHAHEAVDLDGTPLHIVHRDVSPHNVFVTYEGEVKVLDFGIAKAADSTEETQTGVVKGKATYMAPEQAARRPVDRRADIFAVGVMLWQALTGQRLWGELSDFEIFLKLRSEAVPSPRTVRADVPEELEAICARALASLPDERYATAAEMQAALEAYLEAHGAHVGPKQIAKRMMELFAADRAAAKAEIEGAMRKDPAPSTGVEVPKLGASPVVQTASDVSSTIDRDPPPPTRTREMGVAGGRRTALLASAVAVTALATVAVLSLRATRPSAGADAAAGAASAMAARGCTTNRQCRADGVERICRKTDGTCVAVATDACKLLAEPGDLDDDRAVVFGAMFPLTGPQAAYGGTTGVNAIDLARRDFVQIARGLPSPSPEVAPRPLAVVACDDATDGAAAARHLVDDLRVPAVIGFKSSQEVIDLATSLFIPRRVLTVASVNMSALITAIPQPRDEPRLVWRTVLSSAEVAVPVSLMVSELVEKRLRLARDLPPEGRMRLALVRHGTTAGLSFADSLFAHIRYNGKSIVDNGSDFKEIVLPESPDDAGAADVVQPLLKFQPDLVLCVGQGELTAVLAPLEKQWPAGARHRPFYVFANGLDGEEFFRFVGSSPERRRRVLGVAPPATTTANTKLTLRYNETFAEKVTLNLSPTGPYDAMYLLAYAAYAAGDAPLTGPALARAMARLVPPGKPIDIGPARIFDAFEALARGEKIDLNGAGNRLDFDLANGESPGDYTVQCVAPVDNGASFDTVESGVTYDATTKTLKGTLRCP